MAYCAPGDLPIGKMPLPPTINLDQKVQQGADEMDIYLGQRYVTPVVLTVNDPKQRPSALMLKLINANLSGGRILLEITSPVEDKNLHAYGASLVKDALTELVKIREGSANITGAVSIDQTSTSEATNSPRIYQKDLVSRVDAFYDVHMPGQGTYGLGMLGATAVEQTPAYVLVQGSAGPQGTQGPQGAPGVGIAGPKGEPGPKGDTGSDVSFTFYQTNASATWTINHPFLRLPVVTLISSAGLLITQGFSIQYASSSQIVVTFGGPTSGMAVLT